MSAGHVETVSSPNHIFSWASLTKLYVYIGMIKSDINDVYGKCLKFKHKFAGVKTRQIV